MKALPYIIVALGLALVVRFRLRRRRTGSPPPSPLRRLAALIGRRKLFGDTGLVAWREIRERLRSRMFRVVTVVLLAVVAAAVVIPTIHSGTTQARKVGVVAGTPSLRAELEALARGVGIRVELVGEPDLSRARAALGAGRVDMVVAAGKILVKSPISASDTSSGARYVRDVSLSLGEQRAFAQAGLSPAQAATVAKARPLPVDSIQPGKSARTTSEATALLGVILIFIVLTQYLTWTLMGVMEEKASRVVEVLLATVRPIQLLAGKVSGIGAVALAQATALVAFALILGDAVGSSLVHGTAPVVVVATLVWLVLGYAFYSWVYAAAGSLAERQDQVQSLALPLSAPLIFGYIVSLIGVSSGSASVLVKVLAYLPPTAPFAMPTLVGFGEASWWQFLLSAAESVVCTVGVALVAARVYRAAVLRTGARVRLRELVPKVAG
jgi:ABC-2 type transport system permease protein